MTRNLCILAMLVACGDTTNNATTQLNLNRPVDLTFACFGGLRLTNGVAPDPTQQIVSTAQPLESCDVRSEAVPLGDPQPVPPGQEDLTAMGGLPIPAVSYYGFILQSVPGTVAIARWDTKPSAAFVGGDVSILDADPLTPGQNGVAMGENPVALVTDRVGCFEVSANAGSCDLSTLNIASAVNATQGGGLSNVIVDRIAVTNSAGVPIRARPAAMKAEAPSGSIGFACPATATGVAYIAYPSCHLVAQVDLSTGMIVSGIQYDVNGVPTMVGGNVTCPDECSGAPTTAGVRPVALDLLFDTRVPRRTLAIGSANSSAVTIVDLNSDFSLGSISQVPLQDPKGTLGVTQVAISPQIGIGGSAGVLNDDTAIVQKQFVYAVATDGTVRVADIFQVRNKECDTQVDPRFLHDIKDVRALSCLTVGDPTTPPRRPGARGPGIELPGDGIPTSVGVFQIPPEMGDARLPGTPQRLIGYFGVISAANGGSYIFNVDDDDFADFVDSNQPLATQIPMDIAHQLRDSIGGFQLSNGRGELATTTGTIAGDPICDDPGPDPAATPPTAGVRAPAPPTFNIPAGTLAPEKVGALASIRQVKCIGTDEPTGRPVSEITFSAPVPVRDLVFPDLRGTTPDETWSLSWEGPLSTDKADVAIDGPGIREGQIFVDAAGVRLDDATRPFCAAGTEPYDLLQLRGCDPTVGDADCPIGYTCYVHPNSQVTGLGACMLSTEADRLANACKEFLISLRRYTVGKATTGELVLVPRKHVLSTTPIEGCTTDAQCKSLADYLVQTGSSANPIDHTLTDTHAWVCQADPDRAPVMTGKRCLETCATDADCSIGTVCQAGLCMESVVPPQACVNSPQKYELRAHEAFTVLGSRSGYSHAIVADSGGNCVRDLGANPLKIGRIPLSAPACDPTADPRTGVRSDGTRDPNPCELTANETENQVNYLPGTCTAGTPATSLVDRPTQGIRFRNRAFTITVVDPTYPGDAVCIGDRGAGLGDIPITPPGFQVSFRLTAGFTPLLVPIQPSLPIRVVRGPQQSIWVIDEGDFLSTSITQPSTRGKVFRVESQNLTIINLLQ